MDFLGGRTRFDELLGTKDATDRALTTTERDYLLVEAYLDYVARFSPTLEYSADVVTSANPFTWSTNASLATNSGRMPIRIDAMEWKSSGRYIPLKRQEERAVGLLRASEDAAGNPTAYGAALIVRTLANAVLQAQYRVRIYPRPSGSQTFRFLCAIWPNEPSLDSDGFILDDPSADTAVRMAVWRGAEILGYSQAWIEKLLAPIPDQQKTALTIAYGTRWQTPKGLERAVTLLESADAV